VEVEHPDFGPLREVRSPVRTEGEIRNPTRAPRLGEHTDQILRDVLSYSDGTIARLRSAGVIGQGSLGGMKPKASRADQ
jgi:formyl-CoA transferase